MDEKTKERFVREMLEKFQYCNPVETGECEVARNRFGKFTLYQLQVAKETFPESKVVLDNQREDFFNFIIGRYNPQSTIKVMYEPPEPPLWERIHGWVIRG